MKPNLFCKLLLLAALLFVVIEGAPESYPWLTPIPNIDSAMQGFDPVMANPFETPNPGIRNQIFEPMNQLADGRITVNSFIDKVSKDLQCDAQLSGKTIRNYNEYRKDKLSLYEFAFNADASLSASAGYGRESTSEESGIQKLFVESNGEVVKSEAECITHSVGISLFEKPVFTAAFKTALRELHVAAKTPDTNSSGQVFVKFVQSYGTHFMKTTFLGSKLIFEKRFTSKADDSDVQRARSECVLNSSYASLVGKGSSFEMLSKKCESADESIFFFQNKGLSSEKVVSIGSSPHGDLKTWSNTVKESPTPIFYELEKISNFFQSKWFSKIPTNDTDPTSERLNGTSIYAFFETRSASYCQLILGKTCDIPNKGCGYNSLCRKNQTCVTDQSTDDGYICSDVLCCKNQTGVTDQSTDDGNICSDVLCCKNQTGVTDQSTDDGNICSDVLCCKNQSCVTDQSTDDGNICSDVLCRKNQTAVTDQSTDDGNICSDVLCCKNQTGVTDQSTDDGNIGSDVLYCKNQTGVTDQSTDDGNICSDVNKYGPALIMGGYNDGGPLLSGDAIDTWILPNLPVAMYAATLSAVGSNIYNCGGHRSSGERTSLCYVIDRAAVSPQWVSTTSLPETMDYHTSVTIKDHIWTVYNNKLYDLNTNTNEVNTNDIPLTVTSGHCAVSNGSHSFIFGAGSSFREIWVNTEEYNPAKWHRVGNSKVGRMYSGCVWFEQEVFITGGFTGSNSAEVFDTLTYSTRSAGSLIQGRWNHRMMVLDGSPAVLGGLDGEKYLGSIETYDSNTGRWVVSSRSLGDGTALFGLVQLHG